MRKKKNPPSRAAISDSSLLSELAATKLSIDTLLSCLNEQTDPDLIDSYSYELKGAYLRYKFLIKQARLLTEHTTTKETA